MIRTEHNKKGVLSTCRVIDLCDQRGQFCGKVLADLGADVIKVEPPGGDPARRIGPFYHNNPDLENSLFWFAYNNNKRGITLNIETKEGQEIFKRIVHGADFVIESFPVGYLGKYGLGYSDLRTVNPRIIMTSITPFGQTGPYKDYKASDIVGLAMGGLAYITGTPEGPPLQISSPQAYLLAAANAAAATMIAHYHREKTGLGQYVDVSMQACVAGVLANAVPTWLLSNVIIKRQGPFMVGRQGNVKIRLLWQCKDGYVIFGVIGGRFGEKTNQQVAEWIKDEGMAPDFFKEIDWAALDMERQTQDAQYRIEEVIARYFVKYTKAELYDKALQASIMLCPLSSCKDNYENAQLRAREYWVNIEHSELGDVIAYPGAFIKASKTPCSLRHRAPFIGEHNEEIYRSELGLSMDDIDKLKMDAII